MEDMYVQMKERKREAERKCVCKKNCRGMIEKEAMKRREHREQSIKKKVRDWKKENVRKATEQKMKRSKERKLREELKGRGRKKGKRRRDLKYVV